MRHRHAISDDDWARIKDLLPGLPGQHGKVAKDNRLFIDAVLWIARTGAPWRDLPERFGNWNSTWRRFDRWARKGVWRRVFEALQDPDLEWLILDSTIIRAHPCAAGAEKNGTGLPVELILTPGQASDMSQAQALIEGSPVEVVVADRGYDSRAVVAAIEAKGAEAVIPSLKNRAEQRDYDRDRYKDRNLAERFWFKAKQCRRVATRYDKTARNFLAFIHVASIMILLR